MAKTKTFPSLRLLFEQGNATNTTGDAADGHDGNEIDNDAGGAVDPSGSAYMPQQIDDICQRAQEISSLTCDCQGNGGFQIAISCKGPDNYQEQLVFDHGQVSYEKTCEEFKRLDSSTKQDLVCVTEYFYDLDGGTGQQGSSSNNNNKPWMCQATINGDKCAFCSPNSLSSTCKDGLTLRCDGYGVGSLCTTADGTKRLSLTNFGTGGRGGSGGGSGDVDPVALLIAIPVAIAVMMIKISIRRGIRESIRGGRGGAAYNTVEMSGIPARQSRELV